MKLRTLGNSDLNVSVVGLGTWAMGNDFFGQVEDRQSIDAIQAAVDSGVTLIDTAPAYGSGHSEEVVGRAIEGRRDKVIVATKVGTYRRGKQFVRDLEPASVRRQLEDSLRRLRVDVIDLYQIHWPDPKTPLEETLSTLKRLHEEGRFRYLGVSNFSVEQMETVRRHMPLTSLQPHFSLLERGAQVSLLPFCRENNVGVLGYGSLAGGILTGKFKEIPEFSEGDTRDQFYDYFREPVWSKVQSLLDVLRSIADSRGVPVAHVSTAWAFQQDGVTCALVGAKNRSQAESNAAAGELELTGEELARIDNALETHFGR
ncbi:aldo/keto reductase [Salinispira pacifica]